MTNERYLSTVVKISYKRLEAAYRQTQERADKLSKTYTVWVSRNSICVVPEGIEPYGDDWEMDGIVRPHEEGGE